MQIKKQKINNNKKNHRMHNKQEGALAYFKIFILFQLNKNNAEQYFKKIVFPCLDF